MHVGRLDGGGGVGSVGVVVGVPQGAPVGVGYASCVVLYRVTHQVVPKVLLTSKQKFGFSIESRY